MDIKRAIVIVLDSVGAGEAEDANEYGDWGANTLLHTLQFNPWLKLSSLEKLGLKGLLFGEKGSYIGAFRRLR